MSFFQELLNIWNKNRSSTFFDVLINNFSGSKMNFAEFSWSFRTSNDSPAVLSILLKHIPDPISCFIEAFCNHSLRNLKLRMHILCFGLLHSFNFF